MTQKEIQPLLQQLSSRLDELKNFITATPEEKLCRKANPETWSAKELLGHLLDSELINSYRLRKSATEDIPTLPGWDQDIWVKQHQYNQWDTRLLVDTLISLRKALIFWLGKIKEDVWEREAIHPRRGKITFYTHVSFLLSHFEHHLKQMQERVNQ